ncbi:oxidoreductase [Acerihabitans sp. KWT182]|uniref:Oxidoreductase n=1 Tax=Acerihabitans sp. KWT182 TaxID=3157919 RepID=A0AAU7Q5D0_9GAMM
MSKNIFITGVSSGLGRAMAEAALARGHRVIGTLRQGDQLAAFERNAPGRAIGRLLDVTDISKIETLVTSIEAEYGAIDVLINNAGYGLRGVVEELALDALRQQFEVNVFAPVALIQAVLPGMRKRRQGHIINISSMGGVVAFPGLGAYNSSKFAILGIGDALAKEVAPLGIHVTTVEPGVFRSDWGGRSLAQSDHVIPDYHWVFDAKRAPAFNWGDPAALAAVVMDVIDADVPPLHLLVGPTAVRLVREKLAALSAEIDRWEPLSQANGEG